MPNYQKKAKNKRIKQEARERRATTDKLKAQQARKRAQYGVSGQPAPVTVIRMDTGQVVDRTSQAGLRKQVERERAVREYHERMAAYKAHEEAAKAQRTGTKRDQEGQEWFERCVAENRQRFREHEKRQAVEQAQREEVREREKREKMAEIRPGLEAMRARAHRQTKNRDLGVTGDELEPIKP